MPVGNISPRKMAETKKYNPLRFCRMLSRQQRN